MQLRLIGSAIKTRRILRGLERRADEGGWKRRKKGKMPALRDDLIVHSTIDGQTPEPMLDHFGREDLVTLARTHEQGHMNVCERARGHKPRERRGEEHNRAYTGISLDKHRKCYAVGRLIRQCDGMTTGDSERGIPTHGMTYHSRAIRDKPRAHGGVRERCREREPDVPGAIG